MVAKRLQQMDKWILGVEWMAMSEQSLGSIDLRSIKS